MLTIWLDVYSAWLRDSSREVLVKWLREQSVVGKKKTINGDVFSRGHRHTRGRKPEYPYQPYGSLEWNLRLPIISSGTLPLS